MDYMDYSFCYFWSPCLEQIRIAGHSMGLDPDHPVVIEVAKNKDELYRLLSEVVPGRPVVVICGIGGFRKTTLAIAVIQRSLFSSFWRNLRQGIGIDLDLWTHLDLWKDLYLYYSRYIDQDSKESHLLRKQEQILSDLFNQKLKLNDCTRAREKLSEAFGKSSKPVYLFIHEALSLTDFEMLLPLESLSRLPRGSMILVTTRSLDEASIFQPQQDVARRSCFRHTRFIRRIRTKYPFLVRSAHGFQVHDDIEVHSNAVNSLSEPQAKRLLYLYASSVHSQMFYHNVYTGVLEICEGIPAVLRIVGSQLRTRGNTVSACNEIVEYHRECNERGLEGGQEHLGERMVDFVYGQLREPCKETFLDIAVFFYNWERWKVAYIVGEMQLHKLEEAALVRSEAEVDLEGWKMEMGERVKMDAIVRARGRKLSKGNRIIDWESFHLLGDHQKLKQTKGIWFTNHEYIKAKKVDLMSTSLRVLYLGDGTRLNGRCKRAFTQLRFLNISYDEMLTMLRLRKSINLRVLIVRLTKRNKPEFTIQLPESLQLQYLEVDVPESLPLLYLKVDVPDSRPLLQINGPSFTKLQLFLGGALDSHSLLHINGFLELQLFSLGGFTSIPESLLNFSCLKILRLYCFELERLPERFGNLSSLEVLSMANCSKLEKLPERFGNLSSMQDLDISHCSMLERLPHSIGYLSSLRRLDMGHCSMLESLPDSFGDLSSSLRYLDMRDCSMLEILPDSFEKLLEARCAIYR